jgi:hypothetical protein
VWSNQDVRAHLARCFKFSSDDPQVLYLIFNRIKSGAQTAIYNSMDGKALEIDKSDGYFSRLHSSLLFFTFFSVKGVAVNKGMPLIFLDEFVRESAVSADRRG